MLNLIHIFVLLFSFQILAADSNEHIPADKGQTGVWITPPGKKINELVQFLDVKNISQWPLVFKSMTGSKFYMVNLDRTHPTYIGSQGVTNLKSFLKHSQSNGKKISFEVGAVYSETCDTGPFGPDGMPLFSVRGLAYEGSVLKQLSDENINIDYLVLDGPFIRIFDNAYSNCKKKYGAKMNAEYVADEVIKYMYGMRKLFPRIQFVLLSNYPNWNAFGTLSLNTVGNRILGNSNLAMSYEDVFTVAVSRAKTQGIPFSSLQIDHPYNYIVYRNGVKEAGGLSPQEKASAWLRIKKLVDHAATFGIPTNVILNSEVDEVSPDASKDYAAMTLDYADGLAANKINASAVSIQSWYAVPEILIPETQEFSFTNLVGKVGTRFGLMPALPSTPVTQPTTNNPGTFNEACYLARYPDVRSKWEGTALSHYTLYGQKENRISGCD